MPVEHRDILFFLNEVAPMLESGRDLAAGYLPDWLHDASLVEVAHTRDLSGGFHDRRARFEGLLKPIRQPGLVFRALRRGIFGGNRDSAFFVPEAAMLAILMRGCADRKIRLPRNGDKKVIAPDLLVGIRIVLDDETLTLE
ncbi:hypothetical protein ACLIR7_08910 [Nitratireductor aquimarinus]|uniref:hypothetical protein n=1 Tax=Nitratireductor aquimarinus TaxID=889300 RepID=UPI00398F8937